MPKISFNIINASSSTPAPFGYRPLFANGIRPFSASLSSDNHHSFAHSRAVSRPDPAIRLPRSNICPPSSAQRRISSITLSVRSHSDSGFANSSMLFDESLPWIRRLKNKLAHRQMICFSWLSTQAVIVQEFCAKWLIFPPNKKRSAGKVFQNLILHLLFFKWE